VPPTPAVAEEAAGPRSRDAAPLDEAIRVPRSGDDGGQDHGGRRVWLWLGLSAGAAVIAAAVVTAVVLSTQEHELRVESIRLEGP
jgi:hypothetical protein